ncbi:hypothetical protein J6590_012447 [Homalodisca vitripennis]|nr:hypothetical protein J6590_012447 [Homalodisca vitripennis]
MAFIESYGPRNKKTYYIGHVFGCKMVTELLKDEQASDAEVCPANANSGKFCEPTVFYNVRTLVWDKLRVIQKLDTKIIKRNSNKMKVYFAMKTNGHR